MPTNWDSYEQSGIGANSYTDYELLRKYAKGKMLEIGCGRGKNLALFGGVGIDISESAVEIAKSRGLDARVADACKLPFSGHSFDFVYCIETIEHIEHPEVMLDEIYRVLRPEGCVFIQTPNYPAKRIYDFAHKKWRDDPTHVSKFSSFGLVNMMRRYFTIEDVTARNSKLPLDRRHWLQMIFGHKVIVVGRKPLNSPLL